MTDRLNCLTAINETMGVKELLLKFNDDSRIYYNNSAFAIEAIQKFGLILDPKILNCNPSNYFYFNKCFKALIDHYEFDFSLNLNSYNSIGVKNKEEGINV